MHQVMQNIKVILEKAGTGFDKVVKANVILTDIGHFQKMNDIYRSYLRRAITRRAR